MNKKFSLILAITCLSAGSQAMAVKGNHHSYLDIVPASMNDNGDYAHGVVFRDKNANSVRDKGEPGIPHVSVSNGVDVVRTNGKGEYEIYLSPESILFITKPANYNVPVDENNLPKFFYIHYPDGTPPVAPWIYDVIESTGPLPDAINFPLIPAHKVDDKFRAMAFADTQAHPTMLDLVSTLSALFCVGTRISISRCSYLTCILASIYKAPAGAHHWGATCNVAP
jgi:hypothetical protein